MNKSTWVDVTGASALNVVGKGWLSKLSTRRTRQDDGLAVELLDVFVGRGIAVVDFKLLLHLSPVHQINHNQKYFQESNNNHDIVVSLGMSESIHYGQIWDPEDESEVIMIVKILKDSGDVDLLTRDCQRMLVSLSSRN